MSYFLKCRLWLVHGLLGLLLCSNSWASDSRTLKFATFSIPHFVDSAERGIFIDLTREIGRRADLDITIDVYPRLRAFQFFNTGEVDAIFPVLDVDSDIMPIQPLLSTQFYSKADYIFTCKDTPLISTVNELEKIDTVGIVLGYPYSPKLMLSPHIRLSRAINDYQLIKKLLGGRIDAAIIEEISGLRVINDLHADDKIQYRPHHPISIMNTYYGLPNSAAGAKLKLQISKALAEMKFDGTYKAIVEARREQLQTATPP